MRICLLTTSFPRWEGDPSGTFVFRLSNYLARQPGVDVDVVAPGDGGSVSEEVSNGMTVRRFGYMFPRRFQSLAYGYGIPENIRRNPLLVLQGLPFFISFVLTAARAARRCDVIHAHWTPTGLIGWVVASVLGKPLVLTIWGTDLRRLPDWFNGFVIRRAQATIGYGAEAQAFLARFGAEGHSIPAPIDLDEFSPDAPRADVQTEFGLGRDTPLVAFVGRLYAEKDPETFIRSIPTILGLVSDASFIVVGTGRLDKALMDLASSIEVEDSVVFAGARSDVAAILGVSDVFVACSSVENVWSTTIVEAAYMEVPCVLTDAGHTGEVFTHDVDCLIAKVGDPEDLGRNVARLLSDPPLRSRLAAGNTDLHRRGGHDVDDIIRQHLDIYEAAIERS